MSVHYLPAIVHGGQKRALDLPEQEFQPVLECWGSNLGPSENQPVLLTADPPLLFLLKCLKYLYLLKQKE